jgi:hypothetical protein
LDPCGLVPDDVSACRTGFAHVVINGTGVFQRYIRAISCVVAVVEGRKPEHGKGLGWRHL